MKHGVSGLGWVDNDLTCTVSGPGGVQVLDVGQVTTDDHLRRPDNALQFALAVGRQTPKPDSDRRGEDGLNDGRVEFHLVVTAPGHQAINLSMVLGLVAVGDETDQGVVIRKLE